MSSNLHYGEFFRDNLGAELVIEHGKKHFSGDDGISELPSALNALLKMSEQTSKAQSWSASS